MKKKNVFLLMLVLVAAFCMCACSNKDDKEKETKVKTNVAVKDIISAIQKDAKVSDFKKTIDASNLEYVYLDIDMANVDEVSGMYISDDKVDEVTVIKAKSGKAADIKKAFEKRVEDQKEVSKQYDTAQYERLNNKSNYTIEALGDYVIISICEDNAAVIKAFESSVTE